MGPKNPAPARRLVGVRGIGAIGSVIAGGLRAGFRQRGAEPRPLIGGAHAGRRAGKFSKIFQILCRTAINAGNTGF
ncbi:MAG: hypothetical protein CM15mP46_7330 [Alphaproteobacteria bacterium]|nr:MAG: hypothetical protein CM15mP46_7330 [Alphaproteobacteria bacterium]